MADNKKGEAVAQSSKKKKVDEKRVYFKQADFPLSTLQQAQKIDSAIVDNFAAKEGSPPDIALAIATLRATVSTTRLR
jgi:hypothetical protein